MERQELWCHACGRYVQFDMDPEADGNLSIICPNCGHEHQRVVKDGIITEERWGSSGGNTTWSASNTTSTIQSTWTTYSSSSTQTTTYAVNSGINATTGQVFAYQSWMRIGA